MSWLKVHDLTKVENGMEIVSQLGFAMQKGERLAIMGETGSGKTSILKMISGMMQPDSGEILFNGGRVSGPLENLIPGYPGIAFLSQYFELRPNFFVHEVLEYANELSASEATELYELCEVTHLLARKTTQLSGGEKQRIALARLLTTRPSLLLLDEPFSHLDVLHKQTIKGVLENAGKQLGFSQLLVSHDPADVLSWADRLLVIRNGQIIADGNPDFLYHNPPDLYTANLLGPLNILDRAYACTLTEFNHNTDRATWILRPQYVKLSDQDSHGISGQVISKLFFGNYYSITIKAGGFTLHAETNQGNFQIGDSLFVSSDPDKLIPI